MFSIVLVCLGLVADDGAQPAAKATPDRAAYEAARKVAGQDAAANVRLALWCERHGMTAERMKHLATAVLHDPSNGLARGLLGLVAYDGKWEPPDEVSRKAQDDPKRQAPMQEYLRRRAKTPDKADDQAKLAAWCDQNGLKDQAVAHYHAVLRLDPKREAAWKHLGYKKSGGHWVKPEWQAAAKHEADEQNRANKHWRPLLEQWRSGLSSRDKTRRASAEAGLAGVTDPRAVPTVWAMFVSRGAEGHRTAVQVLGQIDSPGSSRALALLALSSKSAEARGEAMQILRQRDPRDFAPMLVALIRDPIKYEVKPVTGPGKSGELVIKDGSTNRKRIYTPLAEPNVPLGPNDRVVIGPDGLPVVDRLVGFASMNLPMTQSNLSAMFGIAPPNNAGAIAGRLEKAGMPAAQSQQIGQIFAGPSPANYRNEVNSLKAAYGVQGDPGAYISATWGQFLQIPVGQMELDAQRSAAVARMQLAGDVQAIEAYNAPILENDRRVRQVLSETVGTDQGNDHAAWTKWLVDLFGYALAAQKSSTEETTVIEQVPLDYQPQAAPVTMGAQVVGAALQHACFAARTPVQTLEGPRPIESLRVGDQVLTQDPRSGELKYQAVVEVYHNPPNATFRIAMDGGDPIVATGIHRLWKAGKGWVMTRELKPGDRLRTLGGLATVVSVEADRTQLVYNLQVADGESYFVGMSGVLAHDNSTINPVSEPFDAVGPLSTTPAAKPRSMLGR